MDFAESMISVHHVDKGGMDLGQRVEFLIRISVFIVFVSVAISPPEFTGVHRSWGQQFSAN